MELHLAAAVRADRPLHHHAPGGGVERSPLHHCGLPDGEPLPLLKVRQDPVTVDPLEQEASPRLQHRPGGTNHQPIVSLARKVPEAGEKVEYEVERLAIDRLPHIAEEPANLYTGLLSPPFRHLEQIGREVHAGQVIAAAGQLDGVAALAARKIENAPRRAKLQETFELIDLDRRPLPEGLVIQLEVAG